MDVTDLVFIDDAGYHYADFPSFLAYLTGKYQGIYGDDVYLGSDSQDGQWIGTIAQALYDTAAVGASNYNSFSPSTAQGAGLARVVRINGLKKRSASNSTVELQIGGTALTTITNGIAIDVLNQQWALPAVVTIPNAGTITVTATAITQGAIAAEANTVTGIFTPTLGWQTVNNSAAATVGSPVESDGLLRNRQKISTSIPAQTVLDATVGGVANVAGVTGVVPYENDTDGSGVGPASLPPHSFTLVVEGGTDTDVAETILRYKTPGTNTQGTTSVPLTDSKGVPITIKFYRPTNATISVRVTLTALASWISSNETIIADALSAYIQSIPTGGMIILTQLYAIAYVAGTSAAGSFNIEGIELKLNAGSFAAADIDLAFNFLPICNPTSNVSFVVT